MADNEFAAISNEIDQYTAQVSEQTKAGELDIPLTTTALREYFSRVFQSQADQGLALGSGFESDDVIEELHAFGIHTLKDLDALIPDDVRTDHSDWVLVDTLTGLLRNIMMIADAERYFSEAWNGHWQGLDRQSLIMLEQRGVPAAALAKQYGLDLLD